MKTQSIYINSFEEELKRQVKQNQNLYHFGPLLFNVKGKPQSIK